MTAPPPNGDAQAGDSCETSEGGDEKNRGYELLTLQGFCSAAGKIPLPICAMVKVVCFSRWEIHHLGDLLDFCLEPFGAP